MEVQTNVINYVTRQFGKERNKKKSQKIAKRLGKKTLIKKWAN
jgi:hypothetical protein